MDTQSTVEAPTTDFNDSQPPPAEPDSGDVWPAKDTIRIIVFEDPASLLPGRFANLPDGFTTEWVAEMKQKMTGLLGPADVPKLRKAYGLAPNDGKAGPDSIDVILQELLVTYNEACKVSTAVLVYETSVLAGLDTQKKKGDALVQQLKLLTQQGKMPQPESAKKIAAVKEQMLCAMAKVQEDMTERFSNKCSVQMISVDAIMKFFEMIRAAPDAGGVNGSNGDGHEPASTATEFDVANFEKDLAAFLEPKDPDLANFEKDFADFVAASPTDPPAAVCKDLNLFTLMWHV